MKKDKPVGCVKWYYNGVGTTFTEITSEKQFRTELTEALGKSLDMIDIWYVVSEGENAEQFLLRGEKSFQHAMTFALQDTVTFDLEDKKPTTKGNRNSVDNEAHINHSASEGHSFLTES